MSDKKELNPSPKFPDGEYPQLSPNPNTHDGLVDNTDEKANTQVVNPGQVQEPKNLTVSEIIALIQKYAPQFNPSDVEAGTLISALGLNAEGVLKKQALAGMFDGKYVRIMNAPSSTTLTDNEYSTVLEGVFINGIFLGYRNPILCPCNEGDDNTSYTGFIIGKSSASPFYPQIEMYSLNKNTKVIQVYSPGGKIAFGSSSEIIIGNISAYKIKGKNIPNYPDNTEIAHYICRKGTLEWYIPVAQDGITSGDTIALNSNLGKALIDHLEVEINGHRCRYERTNGNYVVYSWKDEADSGVNLEINMISYNTTNGELSFNQMTFTPDN